MLIGERTFIRRNVVLKKRNQLMMSKNAIEIAHSVDPDQIASAEAV